MGINQKTRIIKTKPVVFIHISFIRMDRKHISKKHVMRPQLLHLTHPALDRNRSLPDHRCRNKLRFLFRKVQLPELVHITSRTDPAEIRCKRQLLRCQIDHKFTRFPDHIIGITGRSDRNISHRRIGTHRTRPRNRYDIIMPLTIGNTHHYSRQRIDHVPRLP